jgi:hypothetical protein
MKRKVWNISMAVLLAAFFVFTSAFVFAQNTNSNSAGGQMKTSGSEVGKAGKSMGKNVKRGRVVRGGKHFGKHMGKAGKHFGKGTKKVVKKIIS